LDGMGWFADLYKRHISLVFDQENLLLQNLIFFKEASFQFMTRDLIPINTKRNRPFPLWTWLGKCPVPTFLPDICKRSLPGKLQSYVIVQGNVCVGSEKSRWNAN
jgi:hypothetical protein